MKNQIFKCLKCNTIVETLTDSTNKLSCCNAQMQIVKENIEESVATEKHIPTIKIKDGFVFVTVGEVEHPMEENHYIEWIEIISKDKLKRQYLNPGDKPKAKFKCNSENFRVRAYCNLHGLWSAEFTNN